MRQYFISIQGAAKLVCIYHIPSVKEFASWKWELPIRVSAACGWGLPDSNDTVSDLPNLSI